MVRPMAENEERTVIISSRELVDHTILSRKKNELSLKRDFLVKTGAKEGDMHLKAVNEELVAVEGKLAPIGEKLSIADMITFVPSRKEIGEYTEKINKYARGELELAIRNRSGIAYDLMKKRAEFVRGNFERRDDIARMTILLNSFPKKDGEALRMLIEEGEGADVDVSFIPKEKQQELVDMSARLGRECCIYSGSFSVDKKKVSMADLKSANEVERIITGGKKVWVDDAKLIEFDENEKKIARLLSLIQSKGAEKTARSFSDEESVNFDKSQTDYLEALSKRAQLAKGVELNESAKLYKKDSYKTSVGDGY